MIRRDFIELIGSSLISVSSPNINSALSQLPEGAGRSDPQHDASGVPHMVSGGELSVKISSDGKIESMSVGTRGMPRAIQGETVLEGCQLAGPVVRKKLSGGGVEFTKPIAFQRGDRRATVVERFLPKPSSIRWEVEIRGEGRSWGTTIRTRMKWPEAKSAKFWTAWGNNFSSSVLYPLRPVDSSGRGWIDPTVPQPFRPIRLQYGGYLGSDAGFSVPIATVIDDSNDMGVSLALSPEDATLGMELQAGVDGSISFSRSNNEISKQAPFRFCMDLIAHEGDWRPALGWMVERYPEYFKPDKSLSEAMWGCGAYSAYTQPLDAERFKKMDFAVNWLASFDWPYLGMYWPPVPEGTEWVSWRKRVTSAQKVETYCRRMREMGFIVLCYFNTTEFGAAIRFPPPAFQVKNDTDLWKHPEEFLFGKLSSGILYNQNGRPIPSWEGAVVMDPGDPIFQDFLLQQAKRQLKEAPSASGICIDRTDWLLRFNYRASDDLTWTGSGLGEEGIIGQPARSLITSWKDAVGKLGEIMHRSGKVIFANTAGVKRLDLMREVDGIFDEFGYFGSSLNQDSFIGVRKPVIAWTSDPEQLRPDPDAYFQRHLFMGAFPMVPYPGNDHSILPDAWAERYYADYGSLFRELKGREWVLQPHVVKVEGSKAKANLFQTPRGFVVPVTFGGTAAATKVIIRCVSSTAASQDYRAETICPGSSAWRAAKSYRVSQGLAITVPLQRGCGMLRLSKIKKEF